MKKILLSFMSILLFLPFFSIKAESDYPGFFMKFDKTSYSIDDTIYLELGRASSYSGDYYVDLYGIANVVGKDGETFLIESNIAVDDSTIVPIEIDEYDQFKAYDGKEYEYSLLVCSSEDGCVMGSTNATLVNIEKPIGITKMDPTNITESSATINWMTNGNYDCTVIYSVKDSDLDDDYLVSTRDRDDLVFGSNRPKSNSDGLYFYNLSVYPEYISDNGTAYYKFICYNDDRDSVTSPVYTLNTPIEVDNISDDAEVGDADIYDGIKFSNIEVPISLIRPTIATIIWDTNYPTNSDVHYWAVNGSHENWNWDKIDDYTQTHHVIELKDLKPFTTYKFTVSGQREAGVVKTTSEEYTFTTTVDDSLVDDNQDNEVILRLQRQITALEKQVIELEKRLTQLDNKFAERYAGTMFLDVENQGRLWYVDPESKNRFYFQNGEAALSIGSKLATGITYENLQKIPVGIPDKLYNLKDSDSDGLSDRLESALGSDLNSNDTDGDGIDDKQELENGYNPINNQKYTYNQDLIDRLEGKMLLQVSGPNSHGEIWYVQDGKRWYGGTEDSMYEIMKARSLGAIADDIRKIEVGEVEGIE